MYVVADRFDRENAQLKYVPLYIINLILKTNFDIANMDICHKLNELMQI